MAGTVRTTAPVLLSDEERTTSSHGAGSVAAASSRGSTVIRAGPVLIPVNTTRPPRCALIRLLLYSKRVLIVGTDTVGTAVPDRLALFGVGVTRVALTAGPDGAVEANDFSTLLPQADVIVLTMPLTDRTRALLDRGALASLPDRALVVDVTGGAVADDKALLDELRRGRLSAALDMTRQKPLDPEHPFQELPRTSYATCGGANGRNAAAGLSPGGEAARLLPERSEAAQPDRPLRPRRSTRRLSRA